MFRFVRCQLTAIDTVIQAIATVRDHDVCVRIVRWVGRSGVCGWVGGRQGGMMLYAVSTDRYRTGTGRYVSVC